MYNANNPELPNTLASLQTKTMNIFLKEFSEGSLSFIGKRVEKTDSYSECSSLHAGCTRILCMLIAKQNKTNK